MKHRALTVLFTLSLLSCSGESVQPHEETPATWERVTGFPPYDVRSMLQFKGALYVSAMTGETGGGYRSAVLRSTDGERWDVVRTFMEGIGPMMAEGDTLYLNTDTHIHTMDVNGEWRVRNEVPWQIADAELNGDMVLLNGALFVSQTRLTGYLYKVTNDGKWTAIYDPPWSENGMGAAKFLKVRRNGAETVFMRRRYDMQSIVSVFNGETAVALSRGMTQSSHGFNAMAMHNDTVFAGFYDLPAAGSNRIMYLDAGDTWRLYGDSLPNNPTAHHFIPMNSTVPTVITSAAGRLFVATEQYGVLERTSSWTPLNSGLPIDAHSPSETPYYLCISFLEYFKGYLIAGYGDPAFMWGTGVNEQRRGLYHYPVVP